MGVEIPLLSNFQSWFKVKDGRTIDNYLFRLHHQINFAVILFGVVFTFGLNYLDGQNITCTDKTPAIAVKSCWIHGGELLEMSDVTPCVATDKPDGRTTAYYIWLPFLLVGCMGLAKLPRALWKIIEGGLMDNLLDSEASNIARNLVGQKYHRSFLAKHKFYLYHWGYTLCEILNIACVGASFAICNATLGNKFKNYGSEVYEFEMHGMKTGDGSWSYPNAKCNLFPTEISCHFKSGGIAGSADVTNHLCILSNNLFNQFYFAVLWFWWVILLVLSSFGLVYRIGRIFVPDFNKWVVGVLVNQNIDVLDLDSWELFLLGRISRNVSGRVMKEILEELKKEVPKSGPIKLEEKKQPGPGPDTSDMGWVKPSYPDITTSPPQ